MPGIQERIQQTRAEWEVLGFFYGYDDASRNCVIRANRRGMQTFCAGFRRYAADPTNAPLSEHEHYGPYAYLKFVTWTEPKVEPDGIYGKRADFERLADLVEKAIARARPGDRVRIDEAYSKAGEAKLELVLEPDDFEVASADPELAS